MKIIEKIIIFQQDNRKKNRIIVFIMDFLKFEIFEFKNFIH